MDSKTYREYYYSRYLIVSNVRKELKEWTANLSDEIKAPKEFKQDIKRALFDFTLKIGHFNESRNAVAKHKKKDYLDELEKSIDSLTAIEDMLTDINNPLFDNSKKDYKILKKIQDSKILLLKKIMNEHELQEGALLLASEFLAKNPNHTVSLEELGVPKRYSAYKTKRRSDLRSDFILNLATVFKEYTGRTTLKRTSKEIAKRKKTPFKELVEICFKVIDERVTDSTLKKLLASVNWYRSKTRKYLQILSPYEFLTSSLSLSPCF